MKTGKDKIAQLILDNSLWLVACGLCLASSGIDGAYLAKMMVPGLWILGYILNTMSDVAGMVLMYWFGRLRQERRGSKRYRLAIALLPAEIVTVLYSWFFSWRQLKVVLLTVEGTEAQWVAPLAAGFIPALLAFIGLAQALREGRFESTEVEVESNVIVSKQPVEPLRKARIDDWRVILAEDTCPRTATMQDWRAIIARREPDDVQIGIDGVKMLLKDAGLAMPSERTLYNWARMTRNGDKEI